MKNKSRLTKFSICIRKETLELIDQKANEDNRSRSAMIDMICHSTLNVGGKVQPPIKTIKQPR